jgi:hypothetical protein
LTKEPDEDFSPSSMSLLLLGTMELDDDCCLELLLDFAEELLDLALELLDFAFALELLFFLTEDEFSFSI